MWTFVVLWETTSNAGYSICLEMLIRVLVLIRQMWVIVNTDSAAHGKVTRIIGRRTCHDNRLKLLKSCWLFVANQNVGFIRRKTLGRISWRLLVGMQLKTYSLYIRFWLTKKKSFLLWRSLLANKHQVGFISLRFQKVINKQFLQQS